MHAPTILQTFIKTVNYNHIMPTRYTLDVDFKASVSGDVLENSTKKIEVQKVGKGGGQLQGEKGRSFVGIHQEECSSFLPL